FQPKSQFRSAFYYLFVASAVIVNSIMFPIDIIFIVFCIYVPILTVIYLLEVWVILRTKRLDILFEIYFLT
ncbi:hypothetical protein PMAYCL1PPCAC_09147, partial [Pristionchus mayeri]